MLSLLDLTLFVEFLLCRIGIGLGFSQLSFEIALIFFQLNQLEMISTVVWDDPHDLNELSSPILICLVQPSTLFAYRMRHCFRRASDTPAVSFAIHREHAREANPVRHSWWPLAESVHLIGKERAISIWGRERSGTSFTEALREQFTSDRTNASFPCLALL